MKPQRMASILAMLLVMGGVSRVARAVVQVDLPVSRLYSQAVQVLVGTTVRVAPDKRLVAVQTAETIKGKPGADRFNIQIATPQEFIALVKPGQPVVAFVGASPDGPVAILHLADDWLMARQVPESKTPTWRVFQKYAIRTSFSGRTRALVRLVADLKAGTSKYLNAIEPNVFRGGPKLVANLQVRPTSFRVTDVNGDKRPDFLVGVERGVRLFIAGPQEYRDETAAWGLTTAIGVPWLHGDLNGDSKPELFIGATLWEQAGAGFKVRNLPMEVPDPEQVLAAGLFQSVGDERPDMIVLFKSGELHVFENTGIEKVWPESHVRQLWPLRDEKPLAAHIGSDWGDEGKPCALVVYGQSVHRYSIDPRDATDDDLERLTGESGPLRTRRPDKAVPGLFATALDIDGNGLLDFIYRHESGGGALMNRGFGTFFFNPDGDGSVAPRPNTRQSPPLPWKLTPRTIMTAADLHADKFDELLIVTESGEVFAQENPPFSRR